MKKTIKLLITIGLALTFLSFVAFLAYKYWSPLSKKLKLNFAVKDGQIIRETSGGQGTNNNFTIPRQIIQSAVNRFSMDIKSGNQIESIVARIRFKTGPKEIKLGVRGNEKDDFTYQPFYHKLLQNCSWNKVEDSGNFLYQKVKKYDSVGQLINDPPDYRQIATYNIQPFVLIQKLLTSGIDTKNAKPIDVKTGLRGTHIFMIRVDKIPFVLKLTKQDFNGYVGEDKYIISINHNGQLIEEKIIPDDGFIGTESFKKEPQSAEFNLTAIEPGIYEINAKYVGYGDDSMITNISSNQSKMVIKNNVFTFFNIPISLYTKTSTLTLTSVHKESLQTVKLNNTIPLELKKEREDYIFDLDKLVKDKKSNEFYKLETPRTDVIFTNTGYFAFAPEQYFDPEIIHGTNLNTIASLDEVDYLLTSVPKATQDGDWLASEVTFDSKDIKLDEDKILYFSLEMPDLAKYSGELEIDSFTVDVNLKGVISGILGKKQPTNDPTISSNPNTTPTKKGFFQNIWNSIKNFFTNLWPFGKKSSTEAQTKVANVTPAPSVTPTVTVAPNPSASPSGKLPSLTPTPTAKPTPTSIPGINKDVKITVFNSGAPAGYAKKYTDLVKAVGYLSVTAGNANTSLKNVLITYPDKFKVDVSVIENILKAEYKNIVKTLNATSSGIVVNIGTL